MFFRSAFKRYSRCFQVFFLALLISIEPSVIFATWSKANIDRYDPGQSSAASQNNVISSTTNFDSSKYPTCKANSRPKECNVFNECKDVCSTVNKPNCVTR